LPEGSIHLSSPAVRLEHDGKRITSVVSRADGREQRHTPNHVISTMPITELLRLLSPAPPPEVMEAASALRYRDMVILFLTLNRKQVTPDHWIYFSTDDVFFGRLHEPKNWSAKMAPPEQTGLVVEVFCFEDEPVWAEPEESLRARIAEKLEELKLIHKGEVAGSRLVRLRKAYPLYVPGYEERLRAILGWLGGLENLQVAGRNGRYFYTSGDYYIEMGLRAADNVMGARHDLTMVGSAKEYAEQ
jgi:protoporphyrinogen oxidase